MPYGWAGQILRIDLTKRKIVKEPTQNYIPGFIGGRGINAKVLYESTERGLDPLGPENVLIFGAGPLVGTGAPSCSRTEVTAKSPLTGFMGSTNFGGFFAAELKFAGYDHIVIQGKSEKPVYIFIRNEDVEIRDARDFWGMDTFKLMMAIRKELGDPCIQTVCIGPAGERLVRFASVQHDLGDAGGRTGIGAVMGSKNLKAIAVRGTNPIKIADPRRWIYLCHKMREKVTTGEWYEWYAEKGSGGDEYADPRMTWLSWRNKERATFPSKSEGWRVTPFVEKYSIARRACFGCQIGCMQFIELPGGDKFLNSCQALIEPCWALDIPDQIIGNRFARFCEMQGLDVIGTAHLIAMLFELYERKIITEKDMDNIPLRSGDKDAVWAILHKIINREGIGDILAEGPLKFAQFIGRRAENFVIAVKGLTCYGLDVRATKGAALATAVGHRGDMIRGLPTEWIHALPSTRNKELLEKEAEKICGTKKGAIITEYEGKPAMVKYMEDEVICFDIMGICRYLSRWLNFPLLSSDLAEMFSVCTGVNLDAKSILNVAERVRTLERCFDVREGLTSANDTLPKRFFDEPLPDGAYKGEKIDRKKFEKMKREYYALRGWDINTGVPTTKKLKELELENSVQLTNHTR